MEEIESRFERILNKLTMFLNQDNIDEHDMAVEIIDEKEVNSERVKLTFKKM